MLNELRALLRGALPLFTTLKEMQSSAEIESDPGSNPGAASKDTAVERFIDLDPATFIPLDDLLFVEFG